MDDKATDILSLDFDHIQSLTPTDTSLTKLTTQTKSVIQPACNDISALPNTLQDLLTLIIKPLFTSPHSSLTSSGRKRLVPSAPTFPNQTSISSDLSPPEWQNPLTIPLLTAITGTYPTLPPDTQGPVFSQHFYLIVPAVLNIIDHYASSSKANGYALLRLLCETDIKLGTAMVKRSGLADVFIQSLKTNFMLVPSLSEEEESLMVLRRLYPAFYAVVDAGYSDSQAVGANGTTKPQPTKASKDSSGKSAVISAPSEPQPETDDNNEGDQRNYPTSDAQSRFILSSSAQKSRLKHHTLLLRHAVLAALLHLNTSSPSGPTYVALTIFLLEQLHTTIIRLDVFAVREFDVIIPMMTGVLMNPFSLAATELIEAVVDVCLACVRVGWERVRSKWWGKILRGVVGCWVNCLDEMEGGVEGEKRGLLEGVQGRLRGVVRELGVCVEKEVWADARRELCEEELELEGLFEGHEV